MHSNSFRLQVLMSLLLSHLYACMRIIYMYDPPPNFDTNPRSKKKHKTLENTGQPHQTRVHGGGGTIYTYIYTLKRTHLYGAERLELPKASWSFQVFGRFQASDTFEPDTNWLRSLSIYGQRVTSILIPTLAERGTTSTKTGQRGPPKENCRYPPN